MTLKHYLKHLCISLSFYSFLILAFFIYLYNKNNLSILTESSFLHFDASLYQNIKNNGYHENWLCAFFPAFPFLWSFLNVTAIGISIVNSLIFIFSFSALSLLYKLNLKQHLYFLSIPSLIFMFIPYTEALFFASGTIFIIGLNKKRVVLVIIGLLTGSLVRPTAFVFIPAIIGTYYIIEPQLTKGLKRSVLPILALIAGLFITITIHHHYSKIWFVFFDAQRIWENYLHFPKMPLRSWGGDDSTRFDGSVLAISLFCGGYLIYLVREKLKKTIIISTDLVFSLFYLFGTSLLIIAYRDGNLYSLNRFILATPFIIVALAYFFNNYDFKWSQVWLTFFVSESFWLFFSSYNHIHNFLMFSTVSLYFLLLLFSKHANKIISLLSIASLILINCIGFIKLAYRFLNNQWVG